jgi:hypothetical protein
VSLQRIGREREGAPVGQLDVGDLQLGPLGDDDRPVCGPVELKGLAWQKLQRNEGAATAGLLLALSSGSPIAREGRHPIARAIIAKSGQIGVQLLDRTLLLARLACFQLQHRRQFVGIGIEFAGTIWNIEPRLWISPGSRNGPGGAGVG